MLRPEANVIPEGRLLPEQEEACDKLEKLLESAQKPKKPTEEDFRTNRTIFIDGIAGVGKTSIYLTLKAKRKNDFVWLEPLELAFLDQPANALADLLTHIQNLCSGPARPNEKQEEVMRKLARLQRDIALLWDGNPRERAARIQPDAFAVEVSRASRARSKLRKDLNKLIDEVSAKYFEGKILVLPIDDLHERPAVALAILRLMRVIHSPRLVILAIGNFHSLRMIEQLRTRRELTSFMHEGDFGDMELFNEVKERATTLSTFSINKLFCHSQIVEVYPPDPDEGDGESWNKLQNFKPLDYNDSAPGLVQLFREKLAENIKSVYVAMDPSEPDENLDKKLDEIFRFCSDPEPPSNVSNIEKMQRWIFKVPARSLVRIYRGLNDSETMKYPLLFCMELLEECQLTESRDTSPRDLFEINRSDLNKIGVTPRYTVEKSDSKHLVVQAHTPDSDPRQLFPAIAAWTHLIYHICYLPKPPQELLIKEKNPEAIRKARGTTELTTTVDNEGS